MTFQNNLTYPSFMAWTNRNLILNITSIVYISRIKTIKYFSSCTFCTVSKLYKILLPIENYMVFSMVQLNSNLLNAEKQSKKKKKKVFKKSLSASFPLPFRMLNGSLMDSYLGICSPTCLFFREFIALMNVEDSQHKMYPPC